MQQRFHFYYGWIHVVMAAWAMVATLPGRTHGLGLITKPLPVGTTEARSALR